MLKVFAEAWMIGMSGMLVVMLIICTMSPTARQTPWSKKLQVTAITVLLWPIATYKMMSNIVRTHVG